MIEEIAMSAYKKAKTADGKADANTASIATFAQQLDAHKADIVDAHIAVGLLLNYARQNSWEIETGTITLTNTLAFPFNDSIQTVSLSKRKENPGYIVLTEIVSASGNVGEIEITDKLLNGFKIAHTGSSKSVNIKYTVIGGYLR